MPLSAIEPSLELMLTTAARLQLMVSPLRSGLAWEAARSSGRKAWRALVSRLDGQSGTG